MTHCLKGSDTTGQLSTMPALSRSQARSSGVVAGVMRSTIELGNVQCSSTQPGSVRSSRAAADRVAARVTSPLRGTLSQLRIVIRPALRRRLSESAEAIRSKVVRSPAAISAADGSA
jgi:hypothetical protein